MSGAFTADVVNREKPPFREYRTGETKQMDMKTNEQMKYAIMGLRSKLAQHINCEEFDFTDDDAQELLASIDLELSTKLLWLEALVALDEARQVIDAAQKTLRDFQ
tara:strand:+ start:369 stop:686 length:318 start_codon:yes stop_codon:yes gene_type:complete